MMSDEEIGRLEKKASGNPEFGSVEEAERAERAYKREARMLRRKADEAQDSGDSEVADGLDTSADDAEKNSGCCRAFVRKAAHTKTAQETGTCDKCGKPSFLCSGDCKEECDMEAADKNMKKEAAKCENCDCDPCECESCNCAACEGKSASVDGEGEGEEKTADHDVQEEPNLKNDAKGVAVTGKPSPNNNTKAADKNMKKEAAKCENCDCDPCECKNCNCAACKGKTSAKAAKSEEMKPLAESLREQHIATAKMYRKMADEAEERGDFVKADTWDHKAEVCEDLSKDAVIETANPEPELAGVNDATEIQASDSTEREASGEASTEDTDGSSEGSAKTASAEDSGEIEITDDLIEAAVTPKEVLDLRSASSGQRRREPSRVDPNVSGVTRIASCDENAASNDPDIVSLESLWEGAPRE